MIRKIFFYMVFIMFCLLLQTSAYAQLTLPNEGGNVYCWNGISTMNHRWGSDLVYKVTNSTDGSRTAGELGGVPAVVIYNEAGNGIAVFNTSTHFEKFKVTVTNGSNGVTIQGANASNIEYYEFSDGDYFEGLREFANIMKAKGICSQTAPESAFRSVWETYGYEENWSKSTVTSKISMFKSLGIGTLTFDSGCMGDGIGNKWESMTGDFPVNDDIIGSDTDLIDFINTMHAQDFLVRLWWVPAVAEQDYTIHSQHPDWFLTEVIPGTGVGETGDWYLDAEKSEVSQWNADLVERFVNYGFDGFKQDDVYQIITDKTSLHKAYNQLFADNYNIAHALKPDFQINTCNCGLAQNFYDFPGENQLITSDPVGANQFRWRSKYLHALNVNGAAILGDHIELTEGDMGISDIKKSAFYSKPDFASVVALGMVLETKFRVSDPGSLYKKWFEIYNTYKFYNMEWINIPQVYSTTKPESYLMKDGDNLYPSFFMQDNMGDGEVNSYRSYSGDVTISNLESGAKYSIYNISAETDMGSFTASGTTHTINVDFERSVVFQVKKQTSSTTIDVTGVSVSPTSLSLNDSGTQQLNALISPSNATDQGVSWSSSNSSVATVSSSGLVTAQGKGSATITVTTTDGGKTATCVVTVSSSTIAVTGVSVSTTSTSITVGATQQLSASISPSNATNQSVSWSSNNTSVATVSSSGLLTAQSAGSATITVTTSDGEYTATSSITVTSIGGSSWIEISSEGFENGWGIWNDGGTDALRYTGGTYAYAGSAALDIQDNTNTSVITTDALDLSAYSEIKVDFWYYPVSMDKTTEDFWLQISTDGGSSFNTVQSWALNTDFNNGSFYSESVTINSTTLTNSTMIRFRCDASGNADDIYLDEIVISAYGSEGTTEPVTGISISPTSIFLVEGGSQQLSTTVSPSNATNQSVSWSSNNTSVATVSSSGLVTANAEGSTTITATTDDGSFIATSVITVNSTTVSLTNLALNKTVSASSEPQSANPALNAVDNDSDSRWAASGYPQWLLVDLGAIYSINSTELVCYGDRAYQFIVESATTSDGTYTEIVDRSTNTTGGSNTSPISNSFSSIDARYVRITVSGASKYTGPWVSLEEFRIFGNASSMKSAEILPALSSTEINPDIMIYPNPANDLLKFDIPSLNGATKLEIYSSTGQLVHVHTIEKKSGSIDINHLKNGIYFIKIDGASPMKKSFIKK